MWCGSPSNAAAWSARRGRRPPRAHARRGSCASPRAGPAIRARPHWAEAPSRGRVSHRPLSPSSSAQAATESEKSSGPATLMPAVIRCMLLLRGVRSGEGEQRMAAAFVLGRREH